ncbi:MAG: putative GCN5-related N-acetyltransferase [Blastococcus sp.]|jgi:serine/alanine adding enzyme|nr:putative GCN5-related N-acetyltransferase [Blastococcus sp.]
MTTGSVADVVSAGDVRVVTPSEWDAVLGSMVEGSDTYLLAAYQEASALLEPPGTRPVLLHVRCPDGVVALPLLVRPLPGGNGWDATSAYGYGGPVSGTACDPAAFGRALDGWARTNGVVSTFLRLHPVLDTSRLVPPTAEILELGATVAWEVSPGRDLLSGMHAHHRRAARRAVQAGLQVTIDPAPDSLGGFRKLYEATMRRQDADPFFFFPDAYWEALLAHRATLAPVLVEGRLDGEVVSSLLCFARQPWLHYHLGGSTDIARRIGATNQCFLAAAEWAQSQELLGFHLGGGIAGSSESSLFVFKHRFDPTGPRLPFRIAKIVHDRSRYRELAGTDSTEGFFPPWRRPT